MKAPITSVGGRAPPGRNTRTPSARSRWRVGARDSRARARAAAAARPSSGPPAYRRRAHAAAPIFAASQPCTRSSPRSIRSPPTASRARPAAPAPSAPPAPAPPVRTCSLVPWLHPLKVRSLRESRGGSGEPGRACGEPDLLACARPHLAKLDDALAVPVKDQRAIGSPGVVTTRDDVGEFL